MESVLGLYHFDFCLRTLLHEALLKMELNFRTKVIYEASNTYREAPCWFADERYVRRDYAEPFERKTYTRIKISRRSSVAIMRSIGDNAMLQPGRPLSSLRLGR